MCGPVEDTELYAHCQRIAASLRPTCRSPGAVRLPHDEVFARLAGADALFLPSRGENHAMPLEACRWVSGHHQRPHTLERGAAHGAGWSLPLTNARLRSPESTQSRSRTRRAGVPGSALP